MTRTTRGRYEGPERRCEGRYQTPALAFGKDYVLEGEGVTREDVA
jgi:hypothetical protein